MIDSFSKCRVVNTVTVMATKDKQQPISTKKLALMDLPNDTKNNVLKSPGDSPLIKDKTPVSDAVKVSSNGTNGHHLVYARRKLETEPRKLKSKRSDPENLETGSVKVNHHRSDSPPLKRFRTQCTSATPLQPFGDQYWKERYERLQFYLKACDESKREEYIRRLRSLSSAGLSSRAVELEMRTIRLALEEEKEVERGRALKILGKSLPGLHFRDQQYGNGCH